MNGEVLARLGRERRPFGRVARPTLVAACVTVAILVPLCVLAVSPVPGSAAISIGVALLALGLVGLGLVRTAEAFVLLGAFLAPMNNLHTSGALSFVTAADAAFAVGFGLMVPDLIRRPLRLPATFVVGAIGVLFAALISSLLSEAPLASLNGVVRLVVGAFGLAALIVWWAPDLKKTVVVAWAYVLGNVVSVGNAVIENATTWDGRRAGLAEHPNMFGLCALLGLSLIPFLLTQTPRPRRWMPVAAGLVCFWGVWTSGSRGALAALVVVALVYPLISRSVLAALGLLAAFAVGMIFEKQLLGESASGNALGRLLGQGSATGSDEAREQVAEAALEQFQSHPILGVGLVDVLAAHVIYLQIIAAMGVIGLAFFVLAGWATVRPALVLNAPLSLLALPAMSYATLGWVTPVLWDRYIWVTLGLSLLAPYLAIESPPDGKPPPDDTALATGRADRRSKARYA
jgi:hypothetical protein